MSTGSPQLQEQLHQSSWITASETGARLTCLSEPQAQFTHLQVLWAFMLTSSALLETRFGHHATISNSLYLISSLSC